MIKCIVKSNYVDKYTNKLIKASDKVIEISEERYEELKSFIVPIENKKENKDKVGK